MATKYKNVKCTYNGIKFDSIGEKNRWIKLDLLEKAKEISNLTPNVLASKKKKFPIIVNGLKVYTYTPDFIYFDKSGNRIVEDYKDYVPGPFRVTLKLMKAVHGIDILITNKNT